MKDTTAWYIVFVLFMIIGLLAFIGFGTIVRDINQPNEEKEVIIQKEVIEIRQFVSHLVKERVIFTSYYPNDDYNTNHMTSSGLTTNDFIVNEQGWYTYKGYVVVATATELCLNVKSGPCGRFNEPKDTHYYFKLFDTLQINVGGKSYKAIVLDSCGACNWDEDLQRVDVFVSDQDYSFGTMKGAVIY